MLCPSSGYGLQYLHMQSAHSKSEVRDRGERGGLRSCDMSEHSERSQGWSSWSKRSKWSYLNLLSTVYWEAIITGLLTRANKRVIFPRHNTYCRALPYMQTSSDVEHWMLVCSGSPWLLLSAHQDVTCTHTCNGICCTSALIYCEVHVPDEQIVCGHSRCVIVFVPFISERTACGIEASWDDSARCYTKQQGKDDQCQVDDH